ncbi:cilia- and flagella-associated protein 57-like isoform X2 [Silurus meridionalis]|uniref:cilia- and flagella-associated protein 57-like isoform X2 n=1 Tax=Silurus meridionalis TaxID=175797 RepID=UPI001EEC2F4C|nr:cilia- and flagella-associated protein 57-like isoform X2 [Silurus meridionalis]
MEHLLLEVSFNPEDDNQICVTGKSVFKLFELKNDSLRLANSYQMENDEVLCHKWMSGDCIIAGTEGGKLLMLKSTHLQVLGKSRERQTKKEHASLFLAEVAPVTAIHRHSNGFACSDAPGLVCLYEKTKDKENYRKTVEIKIPGDLPLQAIATMCISPKEETLAVTTDRGQMFHVNLTSIKDGESEEAQFEFLSHSYHTDNITGLSMCTMKSLIATCSTDCTVHIWNYKIKSLEQFKQFDKQPLSVSMFSNGLSILVVFSTKICLMNLLYNNIVTVKNFDINNCTECVLNHDCNMFAAVIKNMIHVYNIRTYEKLDLAGHSETVQSVKWSSDDSHLVSCGLDGAVYIWNILNGNYETKIETNCIYVDLTLFPNTGNILTVNQSSVQEIQDGKILLEITSDGVAYTAISITHSERAIFIGTAAGTIRIIELPFKNDKSWIEQQAHAVPITKLAVSPCDQFLLTASKDGTLLIWNIIDQGRIKLEIVKELDYTQEVLCTKEYMEEKLQTIDELTSQVKWLKMQHDCELDLMDVNYNKKMSNIVQNYLQEIKSLKAKIQMLNTEIEDERVSHQKLVTDLKEKHAQELNDLALDYNMRMTVENEVNCWSVHKAEEIQQEHKEEQASLVLAIEDIKQGLEHKLHELQANLDQEKKNSEERERRIKDDTESEITQLGQDYEKDITLEREARLKTSSELEHLKQSILQYTKMKAVIEQQGLLVASAMAEKQMVLDKIRRAKLTIKELTEEMEKQSTTIDEQEHSINELHVKIKQNKQSMEQTEERLLSVTMESKLLEEGSMLKSKEERNEIERLQNEILERNQMYQGFADEVKHVNRKYNRVIDDLKQKLLSKNTSLLEEKQKVKSLEAVVQRTKADIQNCTRFIQEPKKLKENVIELHSLHFHQEVAIGLEAEMKQKHVRNMEHFSKVLKCQKSRHSREIQNEKTTNTRITNESTFMITQINEQELKNQELITSIRMKDIQEAETAAANQNLPGPCQNPTV